MTKEELIRDEDYSEEEAQRMTLQSKLDKANERIEELEDAIRWCKELISKDLKTNERCLKEEEVLPFIKPMLKTWIKYDKELLNLLKGAK